MFSTVTSRRHCAILGADACLFTTAVFGTLCVLALVLWPPGVVPAFAETSFLGAHLAGLWMVLSACAVVLGPVAAWLLHGQRVGGWKVMGRALGLALVVLLATPLLSVTPVLRTVLGDVAGRVMGVAAVALALVALTFLVLMYWLDVDAAGDMARPHHEHQSLDVARLAASVAVVLFALALTFTAGSVPGIGASEAGIFALAAGALGGVVAVAIDALAAYAERIPPRSGVRA